MMLAGIRAVAVGCVCALASMAQQQLSVDKLVQFISSSITQKMADKEVAQYLQGVKMSEKLDPRVIEDLQGKGAGAKTVAALNRLAEASASLSGPVAKVEPPKPKPIPPPGYEDQHKILEQVRAYALNYSRTLPDFIALQVTRRYMDRNYKSGTEGSWSPLDRVAAKLSYFDQQEKYELLSDNDRSLYGKSYESIGGAISTGEFGTVMKDIFDPESSAEFHWERWTTLRGNLCHVYTYAIDQPHARRTVDYQHEQQVTPAYHGRVFVLKGSNVILRVTVEPDMPAGFPIQEVAETIDYKNVDISGQQFLLPLVADVLMRHDRMANKNEIEFRGYRKYSADTSIKFDDSEDAAVPEDQKKEQPAPKQ
jgi:hypothetical protein